MRVEVTGNDGSSLLNQVVPADAPYMLQLKKPNTGFTVKVTKIDGCNAGQSVQSYITPAQGAKFNFSAQRNQMKCKNDGEITMIVPDAFRDVDQIHYKLTKTSGTSYTDVAETTTPSVPKSFIGLEAGTYKITGRATVFHDENNQPVVQDFDQTVTLYTPYGEGLYATVRPDYMVPTTTACPNGRIGLNIEKGSGRYRVYLKSTPDGPLAQPQEIFTDPSGNNYNKLWGQGLKPGHYSLTVSDGCMERDIPDAEILEMPNTPKYTWYYGYMFLDERIKEQPPTTRATRSDTTSSSIPPSSPRTSDRWLIAPTRCRWWPKASSRTKTSGRATGAMRIAERVISKTMPNVSTTATASMCSSDSKIARRL